MIRDNLSLADQRWPPRVPQRFLRDLDGILERAHERGRVDSLRDKDDERAVAGFGARPNRYIVSPTPPKLANISSLPITPTYGADKPARCASEHVDHSGTALVEEVRP